MPTSAEEASDDCPYWHTVAFHFAGSGHVHVQSIHYSDSSFTSTSNAAIPPKLKPSPVKVTTSLPEVPDMAKPAVLPDTTLVWSETLTDDTKVRYPVP